MRKFLGSALIGMIVAIPVTYVLIDIQSEGYDRAESYGHF